jgi:hypothetical protein
MSSYAPQVSKLLVLAALAGHLAVNTVSGAVHGKLKVSENHRYLESDDGTPFFYLADTAWELFHRLNREDASRYLANRSQKGFTVIQAVVLSELGGLTVPNAYGDLPLIRGDIGKPNEAYFRHVDFIINKAAELGLFVGVLPTWGKYWKSSGTIFPSPESARQYGRFVGTRYRDKPVIWILGGDRAIDNQQERATLDALAEGLREGDGGNHLITFHPVGPGDSSEMLNDAKWLDFNMYQSSHAARDHDNGLYAERDLRLQPERPTLDGESRYEEIPVGFYLAGMSGLQRFDDFDVRQAAYWSVLAGACGHTYGDNNVWQMYQPAPASDLKDKQKTGVVQAVGPLGNPWMGREGSMIGANVPWYEALDRPGAYQMQYLRRLFESVPFWKLVPDQSIILNGPTTGGAKIRSARSSDASFAIVYSPFGAGFTLNKTVVKATRFKEFWYDPRYGVSYEIDQPERWGIQTYAPPTNGRGQDWVLLIEDATAGFSQPDPH